MKNFDNAKKVKKPLGPVFRTKNFCVYWYEIPLLPLLPFVALYRAYNNWKYSSMVWDEKIATKVLDKTLPSVLEWVEEDGAFYYGMEWWSSNLWRKAPRRYRKWAKKFERELHRFIKDGYENADYEKSIDIVNYDEVWVKFVERA